MKTKRRQKGLATTMACSTSLSSEAAVLVTSSFDGVNTQFTYTIVEGIYTQGDARPDSTLEWGDSPGTDFSYSTIPSNDSINYSLALPFVANNISFTGNTVTRVSLRTNTTAGGGQTARDGSITFTHPGDLTNLNFNNHALGESTFIGASGNLSLIPEPSSVVFSILGATGIAFSRRRLIS